MNKRKTILISCGGTGGHITPGVALGEAIKNEMSEYDVMYVFSGKKIEKMFISDIKENYVIIKEIKFSGIKDSLRSIIDFFLGVMKIVKVFFEKKIYFVVGFGSATSLIAIISGILFFKPYILLEQNTVMGRANRVASLLAKKIYLSFPLKKRNKASKYLVTGNPMRESLIKGKLLESEKEKRISGLDLNRVTLLIIGGSQGALSLNKAMVLYATDLIKEVPNIQFIHVSGSNGYSELSEVYSKSGVPFILKEFADDMPRLYAMSDIALSRSGASTVFELSYFSIPAVLVPYPYAKDMHQNSNADYVAKSGGVMVFEDEDLKDREKFLKIFKELLLNRNKRQLMAKAINNSLPHDAAMSIVKDMGKFL